MMTAAARDTAFPALPEGFLVKPKAFRTSFSAVAATLALLVSAESADAQGNGATSSYCDAYARDQARYHSRQTSGGGAIGGAARGAAKGAVIGVIVGDSRRDTRRAARTGARIGAISGGVARIADYDRTYRILYDDCMRPR